MSTVLGLWLLVPKPRTRVVREYGLGPVVVGSEAMHPCSLAARGSHMLLYTANISSSRLWSPSEVFASVICLQYSSVSLSSRSHSSIEQAQPPSLKMLSQYWYKIHRLICRFLTDYTQSWRLSILNKQLQQRDKHVYMLHPL